MIIKENKKKSIRQTSKRTNSVPPPLPKTILTDRRLRSGREEPIVELPKPNGRTKKQKKNKEKKRNNEDFQMKTLGKFEWKLEAKQNKIKQKKGKERGKMKWKENRGQIQFVFIPELFPFTMFYLFWTCSIWRTQFRFRCFIFSSPNPCLQFVIRNFRAISLRSKEMWIEDRLPSPIIWSMWPSNRLCVYPIGMTYRVHRKIINCYSDLLSRTIGEREREKKSHTR